MPEGSSSENQASMIKPVAYQALDGLIRQEIT